jgi:hypothetical protein
MDKNFSSAKPEYLNKSIKLLINIMFIERVFPKTDR